MFGNKARVEEDIRRIREANLGPGPIVQDEDDGRMDLELEKNDRLAIILAAFSVILPYAFIFIGVIAFMLFLLYKFLL